MKMTHSATGEIPEMVLKTTMMSTMVMDNKYTKRH
jgi:hypothetical protein